LTKISAYNENISGTVQRIILGQVFWVVIPCNVAVGYEIHPANCSLHTEVPDARFEVFTPMKIQVDVF
jgi:hypothetical protein